MTRYLRFSHDRDIQSFPTTEDWKKAYKLFQKILKSIKYLGIFLAKMLSSFFIKPWEEEQRKKHSKKRRRGIDGK